MKKLHPTKKQKVKTQGGIDLGILKKGGKSLISDLLILKLAS